MRFYEDITVSKIKKKLTKITCDLCNMEAKEGYWESSSYEINEVEIEVQIRQKEGYSYPDCGYGTEFIVDMCPNCFKDKLIPWLKSQGCKTERKDWDWWD